MKQLVPVSDLRIEAPSREAIELSLLALACAGASAAAASAILRWPLPLYPGAEMTADAWYAGGFKLGVMLGGSLLWMSWRGYRLRDVIGPPRPAGLATVAGVALALAAGIVLNAGHIGPTLDLVGGAPAGAIALGVLLPLAAAAIPEELLFRVLLQTRLEKVAGRPAAIAAATGLFALWHLPGRLLLASGVEGTAGDLASVLRGTAIPVLILGLVLALVWDRWRRASLLVALHFAIDLLPSIRHAAGGRF